MELVHNSNSTMHLPVLLQARVAKETGWDGIFVREEHVRRYLDSEAGTLAQLRTALDPLTPVNLGALADVERWRPLERAALLREAEALTELAAGIRARYVQILSGPVDPGGGYVGPAELSRSELRRATAEGLRLVADIGAPHGIRYYLEPIAWTPLSLELAVEAIDAAERDNVGLVLDYWHLWNGGATPEAVARLDPRIIFGVDFSDSLGPPGAGLADQRSRRVWPGDGAIPLREWTDAIRSTGFDGWWDNELYSPPHWELDPFETARGLLEVLRGALDA